MTKKELQEELANVRTNYDQCVKKQKSYKIRRDLAVADNEELCREMSTLIKNNGILGEQLKIAEAELRKQRRMVMEESEMVRATMRYFLKGNNE